MVDAVVEARERGALVREENIESLTAHSIVTQNKELPIDAIIWCTGLKPILPI